MGQRKQLLLVLFFPIFAALAIAETGCGSALTSSLTLTGDLNCPVTALIVGADNLILDCANHKITYASSSEGYAISNSHNNLTVKNCHLQEGNRLNTNEKNPAIYFYHSQNNTILNSNISTTGRDSPGIELVNSDSNQIMNNTLSTSGDMGNGIKLAYDSNSNTISYNLIRTAGASGNGISLQSNSESNIITNNHINAGEQKAGTTSHGIYLIESDSNYFENNNISTHEDNGHGFLLEVSNSNRLVNNKIITIGQQASCLFLKSFSRNNQFLNNTIKAQDFTIFDNTKQDFENYLIYSNPHGQILWSKKDLTTNINLSIGETVFLEPNLVGLVDDPNALNLNGSAKIAFFNILYPKLPWLLKNGRRCDHTSNCTIIYYTFDDGILKADVSSSGSYSTLFIPTVWHYPNSCNKKEIIKNNPFTLEKQKKINNSLSRNLYNLQKNSQNR